MFSFLLVFSRSSSSWKFFRDTYFYSSCCCSSPPALMLQMAVFIMPARYLIQSSWPASQPASQKAQHRPQLQAQASAGWTFRFFPDTLALNPVFLLCDPLQWHAQACTVRFLILFPGCNAGVTPRFWNRGAGFGFELALFFRIWCVCFLNRDLRFLNPGNWGLESSDPTGFESRESRF